MYIAGSHDRLSGLLSQAHDRAVEVQQILFCPDLGIFFLHPSGFQQEAVVVPGLDLQIIIKIDDPREYFIRPLLQNRLHELSHDTGAPHDDPLPVFHQQAFRYPGLFEKISQVGFADHRVQVGPASRIFGDQDTVVGAQALDGVGGGNTEVFDLAQGKHLPVLQKRKHFQVDLCRALGVIHCPVMVFQRDIQALRDRIEGIFGMSGLQGPGNTERVHSRKTAGETQTGCIGADKADVKGDIMSHQDGSLTEAEEMRQDDVDCLGPGDHIVADPGQLLDLKGNGDLRVDKLGKPVPDLAVHDPDSPDLYDPVLFRRKTGRLQVEHNDRPLLERSVQVLFREGIHTFGQIVDQIAFDAVEDLKEVLAVHGGQTLFRTLFVFSLQEILAYMTGIRKSLDIAVIRDGNGGHPPLEGAFDQVFALRNAVHITHLGVAVELDTFYGGIVRTLFLKRRDLHDALDR